MNKHPVISVVTPSFNSAATIRETIESVRRQAYSNWEHLVVDGGSTDGTCDVLREYPHLHWTSEKDEGHYHAMNKGIARARGEYVVILNADDCFRVDALQTVAGALEKHPDWDGLFGDVVFVDEAGREIYRRAEAVYDYRVLLYAVDYVCHQALFVRRSVYERLGDYRHRDYLNSADYDFKLRLGQRGCRIGHVPAFLVDYRYHMQGQSADRRIIRNMIREAVLIKHEHGNAGGQWSRCLKVFYKAKRQAQKLFYRGHCDLIPGTWKLRPHMRERTDFSSNVGLDKL